VTITRKLNLERPPQGGFFLRHNVRYWHKAYRVALHMSAFGCKADMAQTRRNARLIEDHGRGAADWLG
jgi:hypothetical protein